MPIDFPNAPSVNDVFTSGSTSWRWNGTVWKVVRDFAPTGATGKTGLTGNTGLTVAVCPYKTGGANANGWAFVEIWHAGKANTDEFRKTFKAVCDKHGYEAKFQNRRGYVNGELIGNMDQAVSAAKIFIAALENKEVGV